MRSNIKDLRTITRHGQQVLPLATSDQHQVGSGDDVLHVAASFATRCALDHVIFWERSAKGGFS